ncbi:MAG: pitrilysin family protein [Acidimicrobiia bacterium]|nr:MAG: pitrilysin family protein [Acidimicrobiia bacterium]
MEHELTTLPNGLRLITHQMPTTRSVAIGCWVDTGSRDETAREAGASHFLEHLLFKGSDQWPARRIAETLDGIGAQHNAFTSKEYTCFWTRLRDEDLTTGIEILAEMLQRPSFRQSEIDSERNVVLEEINMNEDDPTDVAHEQFINAMWGDHPLAPPVLGTKASIGEMSRDTIHGYWGRRYTPHSVVVAIAGNLPENLVELVTEHFGSWQGDPVERLLATPPRLNRVHVTRRDTEQAHLIIGSKSITRGDERRFALSLVDHILGGGMSSRLFHEIRETRGLAYAVHTFRLPFADAGASATYVGTTPRQADEVLKIVRDQLALVIESGVTPDELDRAKGHVKGSLAISLEDANSRMNLIGRSEIVGQEHRTVDQIVEAISAVTHDDVIEVAMAAYDGPYVIGAVGPFGSEDLEEHIR